MKIAKSKVCTEMRVAFLARRALCSDEVGQGHFSKDIFRIAHMGDIHNDDLDRLEISLRKCFAGAAG